MEENELADSEINAFVWKRIAAKNWSSQEFYKELRSKGIAPGKAKHFIHRFEELGYLDDSRLTEMTVRSEVRKGKGPRSIKLKLKQRGLSPDASKSEDGEPLLPTEDEQIASIQQLLQTKYKKKNLADRKERCQVMASLLRRGYSQAIIIQSINLEITLLD